MSGLELLEQIKELNDSIQVIVITGHGTVDDAVTAMKRGAYDFISKPFKKLEISSVVERAFDKANLLTENIQLKKKLRESQNANHEWGKSLIFKELLHRASQAAKSDATVLVLGESGTGKEVLANFIVENSHRHNQPFIKVNCAAIPESLLEAELFGYKKGSFTGANQDRKGKFIEANGGTLFLDEIGEVPLTLQPKLLRVLQEGEINPIGGSAEKIDVRIIAATNRRLRSQVKEGLFREDLYYRLNVIPLTIPPLRDRPEDLPSLISHFIAYFCRKNSKSNLSVSAETLRAMERYTWPGNVRELENSIERAVILTLGHQITLDDLPPEISHENEDGAQLNLNRPMTMEEIELRVIQQSLRRHHGDKLSTAEELGISLRTIYRKLESMSHLHPDWAEELGYHQRQNGDEVEQNEERKPSLSSLK